MIMLRQYKTFTGDARGNWGEGSKKKKKKKRKKKNTHVKYYISSLKELQQPPDQVTVIKNQSNFFNDRSSLHIEQNKRPSTVTEEYSPRPFCQYRTVDDISELKQVRHSRRHLAIEGDQSEAGLRRLRQPAPIDGGIGSASISSTTGQLISDETPPSTGGSAAKQAHREADQKRVPIHIDNNNNSNNNKHSLPPTSLSTAFLRLHAKQVKHQQQQQQNHQTKTSTNSNNSHLKITRTTAKPRNDLRGALELPQIPQWQQMMNQKSSGKHRNIATPLPFPQTKLEREEFDRSLTEWEELSRKRIVAREQNKKQMSFLVANHQTYIERVEHARAYYRKTTKSYYIKKWYRRVRYRVGLRKIHAWRLHMLCEWGFLPWKKHWKKYNTVRTVNVIIIQKFWKKIYNKTRYVRKVDFSALVVNIVKAPVPMPEKMMSMWQRKLRGLMIASVVGLFIWGGEQFEENWYVQKIAK